MSGLHPLAGPDAICCAVSGSVAPCPSAAVHARRCTKVSTLWFLEPTHVSAWSHGMLGQCFIALVGVHRVEGAAEWSGPGHLRGQQVCITPLGCATCMFTMSPPVIRLTCTQSTPNLQPAARTRHTPVWHVCMLASVESQRCWSVTPDWLQGSSLLTRRLLPSEADTEM